MDMRKFLKSKKEVSILYRILFQKANTTHAHLCSFGHSPSAQPIDIEFIAWLGRHKIPFYLVFTKADKLSLNAIDSNIVAYQKVLKKDWEEIPLCFVTSVTKKLGLKSITESIGDLLIDFAAAK